MLQIHGRSPVSSSSILFLALLTTFTSHFSLDSTCTTLSPLPEVLCTLLILLCHNGSATPLFNPQPALPTLLGHEGLQENIPQPWTLIPLQIHGLKPQLGPKQPCTILYKCLVSSPSCSPQECSEHILLQLHQIHSRTQIQPINL